MGQWYALRNEKRGSVMKDVQLVDLHKVQEYWESRNLVHSEQLPHYVRWLSRFLSGPGGDANLSAADALRLFVEQLERRGDVPDWQIRQAARAVELYQRHYLQFCAEKGGSTTISGPQSPTVAPSTLPAALDETRRLVRLRIAAPFSPVVCMRRCRNTWNGSRVCTTTN